MARIRTFYRLVAPDGRILSSAKRRALLEQDIRKGWAWNLNENDEVVRMPLPEDCHIIAIREED